MTEEARRLAQRIVDILDDKKALDIELLDISQRTIIADAFVICAGRTSIQVRALADEVEEALGREQIRPLHKEGYAPGRWVLLDYGGVVVHIFHREDREFYSLERLWSGMRPGRNAEDAEDAGETSAAEDEG